VLSFHVTNESRLFCLHSGPAAAEERICSLNTVQIQQNTEADFMSRINCTSWELNFLLVSHQLSCIPGANATLKAMNHTASCGIRRSCLHFCNDHLATVQNNDWYAPFTVKAQKHKAQRVGVQRAGEGVVYIAKPWTAWGSSAFFSYGPLHSPVGVSPETFLLLLQQFAKNAVSTGMPLVHLHPMPQGTLAASCK
jgi:hypothetical protein